MKGDDFDKALEGLQESIEKIGTKDIEGFLAGNYSEKWSVLTNEQKQLEINKIRDFLGNPQNKSRIRKIRERLEHFESIKFNLGILFLGVFLGISGNLIANLFDKYFVHYGPIYDVAVTVVFLFSLWYIDRTFIKKTSEEIMNDKTTTDLLSILERFESK